MLSGEAFWVNLVCHDLPYVKGFSFSNLPRFSTNEGSWSLSSHFWPLSKRVASKVVKSDLEIIISLRQSKSVKQSVEKQHCWNRDQKKWLEKLAPDWLLHQQHHPHHQLLFHWNTSGRIFLRIPNRILVWRIRSLLSRYLQLRRHCDAIRRKGIPFEQAGRNRNIWGCRRYPVVSIHF